LLLSPPTWTAALTARPPMPAMASADIARALRAVRLAPYSVLGSQLTSQRRVVMAADPPGPDCLFVDPAGLIFIHELGPAGAAGASGAIYAHLGIREEEKFPESVRAQIKGVCDASWHAYESEGESTRHCVHVVGPNFNDIFPPLPRGPDGEALADPHRAEHKADGRRMLTAVYRNVLKEFVKSKLPKVPKSLWIVRLLTQCSVAM